MNFSILNKCYSQLDVKSSRVLWDGLDQSGRNALLELLIERDPHQTTVILCENDRRVNDLAVLLRSVLAQPVLALYQRSHLPVEVLAKEENDGDRVEALYLLTQGIPCVIIANAMVMLESFPQPSYFNDSLMTLRVSEEVPQEKFLSRLLELGYESASICDQPGAFARRGGIVDLFSPHHDQPLRIEWFDDEIDSLRFFSAETQKSERNVEGVEILPAQDIFFTDGVRDTLTKHITQELNDTLTRMPDDVRVQLQTRLQCVVEGEEDASVLAYYAYLSPMYTATLFDYFSAQTLLCIDETEVVENAIHTKYDATISQLGDLFSYGYILPSKIEVLPSLETLKEQFVQWPSMYLSEVKAQHSLFQETTVCYYPITANPLKVYPVNRFIENIKSRLADAYTLVFYHSEDDVLALLANLLDEYSLHYQRVETMADIDQCQGIALLKKQFCFSCDFSQDRCLFMDANIFHVENKQPTSKKKAKKHSGLVIEDLQVGDYIVHEHHGIGLYLGIEHLQRGESEQDYILIQYKGADRLYVPIDQMHLVEKYVGQEGKKPKVNKLGSSDWSKSKKRIQASIEDMAEQLLEVHAKRQMMPGFAFAPDDDMQKEFENAFPYVETDDQLKAIKEVKTDMEKPHAMDRLVCGDVGFGKTEVALRAAFKAVCNHKQVAVLVPTTILAMQHYETFKARMEPFGVEIAQLTRFCTTKEQNKIFRDLANHRLDVVIGTHKLLNQKLHFADLGLLIIDEEQRFGVKHKEKIKSLQESVDVLTLSATPIPRTLYFSLTGVKDMSIIETPPDNRLPIQTYVIEEMPMVIEQAVRRELLRGGQVFVVYNNVEHLPEVARKYREMFPNSRVIMGHGRMKEAELEDIMLKFQHQEADILVCTTIIETGIDIPNANTMIVHNADHFGMAQLYQLKGRVGRSKRVAYAYLMYKPDKLLSEEQRKRLNTLREYTALGSGYKISMRDLEIRGSGNMLGAAQSGHVAEIGFELYLKMLQETIRKMKRTDHPQEELALPPVHTEIEIELQAYFPETYISDPRLRIGLYQRLDGLTNQQEIGEMYDELVDRFGMPDEPVLNLLKLVALKQMAGAARILSIKQRRQNIYIKIDPESDFDVQQLVAYVGRKIGRLMLKNINDETFVVMDATRMTNADKLLDSLKLVLSDLKEIVTGESSQYNK